MSVLDAPELVPVPVGYCPCAGTPHPDGDIVYLHAELSAAGGMAVQGFISEPDPIRLQELLARVWLGHGVAAWTFLDDDGKPIPLTPENVVRALPYAKGGRLVADKADALYAEAVLAPLLERVAELEKLQASSPPGLTPASPSETSAETTSPTKRRSPSSIATTDKVPLPG